MELKRLCELIVIDHERYNYRQSRSLDKTQPEKFSLKFRGYIFGRRPAPSFLLASCRHGSSIPFDIHVSKVMKAQLWPRGERLDIVMIL